MRSETILVTSGLPSASQKEAINKYGKEMPLLEYPLHTATALVPHVLFTAIPRGYHAHLTEEETKAQS